MANAPDDPLAAVMRTLQGEYLGEAPERVRELSAALGRLRAGNSDAFDDLRRHFHRLAGSGGSYGFPSITERSRLAEHAVIGLAAAGRPPRHEDLAMLDEHVLQVAAAFSEAQRKYDRGTDH